MLLAGDPVMKEGLKEDIPGRASLAEAPPRSGSPLTRPQILNRRKMEHRTMVMSMGMKQAFM